MENSIVSLEGQQNVYIDLATRANIALLCGEAVTLGAWRDRFALSLQQIDRTAAVKAHDLISKSVIAARQIAQTLSIPLPVTEGLRWELSPRPRACAKDF